MPIEIIAKFLGLSPLNVHELAALGRAVSKGARVVGTETCGHRIPALKVMVQMPHNVPGERVQYTFLKD